MDGWKLTDLGSQQIMLRGRSKSSVLPNIHPIGVYQKLWLVSWTDKEYLILMCEILVPKKFYSAIFDTIKILSRAIVHIVNMSICTRGIRNWDFFE